MLFEYQVISVNAKPFGTSRDLEYELNLEARRGWRVVAVVDNKIIMERPKRARK